MYAPSSSLFGGPVPYRPAAPHPPTVDPRQRRPSMLAPSPVPPAVPAALRRAAHLPPRLREALLLACDERRSIRTVEKLAAAAGCDRRTLWTHWKNAVNGRGAELRLQDFLHWVILLRAAHRKRPSLAWADVADELGIHPHTLSRLARQLTGAPLRDLAAGGHTSLAVRFEAEVLAALVPAEADPAR
jgi:AraC-like DNA-binding protein